MLNVTGSHSHLGNPALGEVCHRLVDVFLWQLFPDGLQGDFQLVSLGVYFTLPSWRTSSSPAGTNLDSGVSMDLGRVRLQSVLHDARNAHKLGIVFVERA